MLSIMGVVWPISNIFPSRCNVELTLFVFSFVPHPITPQIPGKCSSYWWCVLIQFIYVMCLGVQPVTKLFFSNAV
jgi:hypothetical protein